MQRAIAVTALLTCLTPIAQAEEEAVNPNPFTGSFSVTTDYIFRGISQSQNRPAVQGGVAYKHSSGLYVGTWASTIAWVKDTGVKDNNHVEIDIYGGFKGELDELTYDLGIIRYAYPGSTNSGMPTPDSTEVYVGLGWKFLGLKYSHAVSKNLYGWESANGDHSRNSNYIELNATHDLGEGWNVSGHVGHQTIKNLSAASYTDWSLGVGKNIGFGTLTLMYTDTNANTCGDRTPAYCWDGKDVAKSKAVLSFSTEF